MLEGAAMKVKTARARIPQRAAMCDPRDHLEGELWDGYERFEEQEAFLVAVA